MEAPPGTADSHGTAASHDAGQPGRPQALDPVSWTVDQEPTLMGKHPLLNRLFRRLLQPLPPRLHNTFMIPPLPACAWQPALPTPMKTRGDGEVIEWGESGMNLVDHFASLAMQAMRTEGAYVGQFAREAVEQKLTGDDILTYIDDRIAYLAYHQAAAMCRAKEKLQ